MNPPPPLERAPGGDCRQVDGRNVITRLVSRPVDAVVGAPVHRVHGQPLVLRAVVGRQVYQHGRAGPVEPALPAELPPAFAVRVRGVHALPAFFRARPRSVAYYRRPDGLRAVVLPYYIGTYPSPVVTVSTVWM